MKVLVVPTNREDCIKKFLDAWKDYGGWDMVIVVEDNPEPTFDIDANYHLSWKDIKQDLGENDWIISRKDSAIRCYGYLFAYRLGAEHVFTLDDDCYPEDDMKTNFCDDHIIRLEQMPRWRTSIPVQRTRGLPYYNFGTMKNVVMNMGFWSNVPDFDSVQMLSNQSSSFGVPKYSQVIPSGQYVPICGMNLAFKKEIIPLCYLPLMGENQPFKRFDDIWFGIILKKICDHLNLAITCGPPIVKHIRASNVFDNLIKEAPGIKANEQFWELIDNIPISATNPRDCMEEMGIGLSEKNTGYMNRLGEAIQIWSRLFI